MSLQCQIYIIQDYFMLSGCLVARSHAVQCSYSRTGAQHFIPRMDRVVFQFTEVGTLPGTGASVAGPSRAMQCRWWCAWLWTAAGPGPEVSREQGLRKLPVPTQTDSSGSGIPAAVLPPPDHCQGQQAGHHHQGDTSQHNNKLAHCQCQPQ